MTARQFDSKATRKIAGTVDGFTLPEDSPLLREIEALRTTRWRIEEALVAHRQDLLTGQADVDAAKAEVDMLKDALVKAAGGGSMPDTLRTEYRTAAKQLVEAQKKLAPQSALITYADRVLTSLDAFLLATTTGKDGGEPPLLGAALREPLFRPAPGQDRPVSHVLFVSLDSIGVDLVASTQRLGGKDGYRYVGGLQVSYLVLEVESGTTVASGTVRRLSHARFHPKTGKIVEHWTDPVAGPGMPEPEVRN